MSQERVSDLYLVLATYQNNGSRRPAVRHLIIRTSDPVAPENIEPAINLLISRDPTNFEQSFTQTLAESSTQLPPYHYLEFARESDDPNSRIRLTTTGSGLLYLIHSDSWYLLEHRADISKHELENLLIRTIKEETGEFEERLQKTIKQLRRDHEFTSPVYRRVEKVVTSSH